MRTYLNKIKSYLGYFLCFLYRKLFFRTFFWRIAPTIRKWITSTFTFYNIKTVIIKNKFRINLDLNDYDGIYIYMHHQYEPRVTQELEKFLRCKENFIDIGANIGFFSLFASKLLEEGNVYSFEASPEIYSKLEDNIKINDIQNITAYNYAISDEIKDVVIYESSRAHRGLTSIRALSEDISKKRKVKSISIDSILDELPKISLVKIDIEGAEFLALNGMKNLLKRDTPNIILELTDEFLKELDSSSLEVCDFLKSFNYRLYKLTTDGYEELDSIESRQCNILATMENLI